VFSNPSSSRECLQENRLDMGHLSFANIFVLLICLSVIGCGPHATSPIVTPPPSVIVYCDTNLYICTMNADGTDKKKLLSVQATGPIWSPKGRLVAASRPDPTTGESWLVTFDVGSGVMTKLALLRAANTGWGFITYSWSPDGQALAFNRTTGGTAESELLTVDVSGTTIKQLTNGGFNYSPRWSPNGQQIAFEVEEGLTDFSHIMNADGSGNQPAPYRTRGLVANLAWSPDGWNVAFNGPRDSSHIGTSDMDVYVCDTQGKQIKRLTTDGMSGVPSWSPDGRFIAFVSRRDGGINAYVMRSDGSGQTRVTNHGSVMGGPLLWSPDGTKLMYPYNHSFNNVTISVAASDGSLDLDLGVRLGPGFSWKQE
jgi:Tol biopolymer transport system component